MMLRPRPPHPQNVPGDYYVEDGCCTTCDVPMIEAPELFAYDESPHCFVKKQPETPDEFDHMLQAVRCQEHECIRYRGKDRTIQSRNVEGGTGTICEQLPDDLRARAVEVEAELRREWRRRQGLIFRLQDWLLRPFFREG